MSLRYLLHAAGRFLAWRARRNAAVDPPLSGWMSDFRRQRVLRCSSCDAAAAHDEVDICHRCRTAREREEAEVAAYAEERRRKRREAARRRARAQKGVLEMPQRARG